MYLFTLLVNRLLIRFYMVSKQTNFLKIEQFAVWTPWEHEEFSFLSTLPLPLRGLLEEHILWSTSRDYMKIGALLSIENIKYINLTISACVWLTLVNNQYELFVYIKRLDQLRLFFFCCIRYCPEKVLIEEKFEKLTYKEVSIQETSKKFGCLILATIPTIWKE